MEASIEIPRIYSSTVRGNSHVLRNIPNQDSYCVRYAHSNHLWAAAIADGHGSSAHPNSEVGSRVAAECTVDILLEYLQQDITRTLSLEDIKEELIPKIIQAWRSKIARLHHEPSDNLENESSPNAIREEDFVLYGTTLAFIAPYQDSLLVGSIGDSDGFWRSESGLVRCLNLFENTGDEIGEETHSLCLPNAKQFFRLKALQVGPNGGTIMLATDGIKKSLRDDDSLNSLLDYYHNMAANNNEKVKEDLEEQLKALTTEGSGDDCTAIVVHFPNCRQNLNLSANQDGSESASAEDIIAEETNTEVNSADPQEGTDTHVNALKKNRSQIALYYGTLFAAGAMLLVLTTIIATVFVKSPKLRLSETWTTMRNGLLLKSSHMIKKAECLRAKTE